MSQTRLENYKEISSMVKEMYSTIKTTYDQFKDMVRAKYHMDATTLEYILQFDMDTIKDPTAEDIKKFRLFLDSHKSRDLDYLDEEAFSDEVICETMASIKELSIIVMTSYDDAEEISKMAREYFSDLIDSVPASKIKENRLKAIDVMKSANELETDENKVRSNERKIKIMEESITFSFLEERFIRDKDDEVNRVIKSMFDPKLSSTIVKKFETISKHLGFPDKIYSHYLNIEENFLPEEYHPFNNTFLYIVMRYVSSVNESIQSNTMNARSIIGSIANLIYHKFDTEVEEKEFVAFIEHILDYFTDKKDYYVEVNTTYKGNAINIEVTKQQQEAAKKLFKENYKKMGIEFDDSLPFEEIKENYNKTIDEWRRNQIQKEKDKKSNLETSDESALTPIELNAKNKLEESDLKIETAKKAVNELVSIEETTKEPDSDI